MLPVSHFLRFFIGKNCISFLSILKNAPWSIYNRQTHCRYQLFADWMERIRTAVGNTMVSVGPACLFSSEGERDVMENRLGGPRRRRRANTTLINTL